MLENISNKYELTGAMIVNIIQYAAVKTYSINKNRNFESDNSGRNKERITERGKIDVLRAVES